MPAPDDLGSVPRFERVRGLRVVADAAALDTARWVGPSEGVVTLLRVAPDEVIAIDAQAVEIDDVHAIVVEERGLVAAWCRADDVEHRLEWQLPQDGSVVAQGAMAGVPVKIVMVAGADALVVTAAAYAHDIVTKLGWRS